MPLSLNTTGVRGSNRRKSTATKSPSSNISGSCTSQKMDATRKRISEMEAKREERRKSMILRKEARKEQHARNLAAGNPGDVDFIGMVGNWRKEQAKSHRPRSNGAGSSYNALTSNICIAVRKRPMNTKERDRLDHDSVSVFAPQVTIHSAKLRVDGITKYLTHNSFQFDHAFGVDSTTEDIYVKTTLPLVDHVVSTQGRATVFCYGQTGSGKTYTMNGIQQILAHDLFSQTTGYDTSVAFFELYGGFIQDLLHERKRCKLLEDGKGEVNVTGLQEVPAPTASAFLEIVEQGHSLRTTHTTEANDSSSRSHAICQVYLRKNGKFRGKLTLVDLAGSERGSDTKSHNSQRRTESAEINTSLLSLKECIRALGQKSGHVPYRGSKLTLILKDCFTNNSKTTMIATVSPGASSTDHSLNTLRYADRIKEQRTNAPSGSKVSKKNLPQPKKPSKTRLQLIADVSKMPTTSDAGDSHYGYTPEIVKTEPKKSSVVVEDDVGSEASSTKLMDVLEGEDESYVPSDHDSEDEELNVSYEERKEEDLIAEAAGLKDEEEMRQIVQDIFQLEEAVLNQHMSNIQEHAEMLTQEGIFLQSMQGASEEEVDEYAIQLAEFLDRKEILIHKLQQKLDEFKKQLIKEQRMPARNRVQSQF